MSSATPLASREVVAEALHFAHITESDGDKLVDIAVAFVEGRLVDREAMTPMYRQGGLSGAWYPETDGDEPDGWLIAAALGDTDEGLAASRSYFDEAAKRDD